ncbi:MAG: alpha/beta fold hydrolase [Pseudomonadota bacterium]
MSEELKTRDVVLLHGLGRTPMSMLPLAWRLGWAGFRCRRPSYPSTQLTVPESIAHVHALVTEIGRPVHLVGHSLGGLIAAALLREGDLPIARAVQLGSPNLGSPAADRLAGTWPVTRICGPAVDDLQQHDVTPETHPHIAAIAGIKGPPLPGIDIEEPHDGIVSQASAWAGAGHRASVPSLHSFIMTSAEAARLTAHFLTHGTFPEGHT